MSRTVEEWIGRTDDSMPPASCKQRVVERQARKCADAQGATAPGTVGTVR